MLNEWSDRKVALLWRGCNLVLYALRATLMVLLGWPLLKPIVEASR